MRVATLFPTQNDLPVETRAQVIDLLNVHLATVMDLHSQTKQAHWNVKGIHFQTLHELFDRLAAVVEPFADTLAERATALGGTALGTARLAAKNSTLPEYPMNAVKGEEHLKALVERWAEYARLARKAIDETAQAGDAGTSDLFTGISREVDKALWFLESHLA